MSTDTSNAAFIIDYTLHETNEGKNLQSAFEIWADSASGKDVLSTAHQCPSSREGKPIFDELEAAHNVVATHGSLDETEDPHSHYAYFDNEHLAQVRHHTEQVGHHIENLEVSRWRYWPRIVERSLKTPEGNQLKGFGG